MSTAVKTWLNRVLRVFELDPEVFEEVEHDHSAGPQALTVVLCASLAGGIGNLLAAALLGQETAPIPSLVVMGAGFTAGWVLWSFVMMAIGTTLFGGVADMGEMQRALGFAAAPGLLMLIPAIGTILGTIWALVAMVIAVRQALDFDTGRALATVALGALVTAVFLLPSGCFLQSRLGLVG